MKKGRKEVRGLTLSHSKIYYKAVVIGQHGIGTKVNKYIHGTRASRKSHMYSHLINDKGDIAVHWKDEDLFSK